MHSTLNQWLIELEEEIEIIQSANQNQEANFNMFTIGASDRLFKDWGSSSITSFIRECAALYHEKNTASSMTFYAWHDEMAGQLRISAVSKYHGELPFSCNINKMGLGLFIKSLYLKRSDIEESYAVNVWQQEI